jgi:hypothetical protein
MLVQTTTHQLRKGTSSLITLTAWWIWKHRNVVVFDNARPSVSSLLNAIRAEARQWVDGGEPGFFANYSLRLGFGLSCMA